MVHPFLFVALMASGFASLGQAADVCAGSTFSSLACLASNTAAVSYCNFALDLSSVSGTATAHVTSTKTIVSTSVVSATSADSGTVTYTTIISSTQTDTTVPETTQYLESVITSVAHTTITVYTSSSTASAIASTGASRADTTGTCDTAAAQTLLTSMAADRLATACSCIGAVATQSTTTELSYATATRVSIVTLTAAAYTTFQTGVVVFTVKPATTVDFSSTTTVTQTQTVFAAAPTYTQIWGPIAGCQETPDAGVLQLNSTVTETEAIAACQIHCIDQSDCESVYVQHMAVDYGTVQPFWKCNFNSKPFDQVQLSCGLRVGTYGPAIAFNAVGRDNSSAV